MKTSIVFFLETDRTAYQQAIDQYSSGQLSWEDSVYAADLKWEKLTGRPYKQSKVIFDEALKLGLKIYAVDWDDASPESKRMKTLFDEGFKQGKKESLIPAFQLGVTSRNKAMAANISEVMGLSSKNQQNKCKKAIMTVGALHLSRAEDMSSLGIGLQKFKAISDFLPVDFKQSTYGIYDCIKMVNAQDAQNACQTSKEIFAKQTISSEDLTLITTTENLPKNSTPKSNGAALLFYKN